MGTIRALIDRMSTISTVVGWLGFSAWAAGTLGALATAVWAVISGVPIPIIVMAAFCMITGAVYLAMAPMAYRALLRAQDAPVTSRPDPEVWRHLPQFTIWQASCLLADMEPNIHLMQVPGSASGYCQALCIEVDRGRINRIDMHYDHFQVVDGHYIADQNTAISKESLKIFAAEREIKRAFLG